MAKEKNVASRIDYTQLFIVFILACTSCFAIYSAQQSTVYHENFVMKQLVFYVIGFIIALVVMQFDAEQLKKASWYLYGFGIFLLVFLIFAPESIAESRNHAKSWFTISGIGSIQPSEFMKIFLIIMLASIIQDHHAKHEVRSIMKDILLLGKMAGITVVPIALVQLQPDLGTELVMVVILVGMSFVSGITWRLLIPLFTTVVTVVIAAFYLVLENTALLEKLGFVPYQFNRIYSWLNPYSDPGVNGYQLIHSLQAIGSGQVTGKGFTNREVPISEAHSDFIFGVIGEEYGFIGASFVIVLFFLLIYLWTRIALETKNEFNSYICIGIISMFTFHIVENIGMTIQLLPITGIPLPFLSYGGSSLWSSMMALGLIFSIRYHHKVYMFSNSS